MFDNDTRKKLENIIQGNVVEGESNLIATARNYLLQSFSSSKTITKNFEQQSIIKEKQKQQLIAFIEKQQLWCHNIKPSNYLTEGGEARIYFGEDGRSVLKLNDAIYYNTWLDFLNSISIHNIFFKETAYILLGFTQMADTLFAVLRQPFIISETATNLDSVKEFLEYNGFNNIRRNDYYNKDVGILLEDMHDENIITNSNILFFIDTVFYVHITKE